MYRGATDFTQTLSSGSSVLVKRFEAVMKPKVPSPFLQNVTPVFFLVQLSPSTSYPIPLRSVLLTCLPHVITLPSGYLTASVLTKALYTFCILLFIYLACHIVLGLVTQMLSPEGRNHETLLKLSINRSYFLLV